MSTKPLTISPSNGWVSAYTGPTDTPIAVEKGAGTSAGYLAIGEDAPMINTGHHIGTGDLKNVVLDAGESLYIRCIDGLSPDSENTFIITD